jgi:hypothetical protein
MTSTANVYWQVGRSWIDLPQLLNIRTSPEKRAWATSAYKPGKCGISPIGCRPKKSLGSENTSKPRRCLFVACAGPLCIHATCLAFRYRLLDLTCYRMSASQIQGILLRSITLVGKRYLEMQTYNLDGNLFCVYLTPISTFKALKMGQKDHLQPQTDIRSKPVTHTFFEFLGPYNNYTCDFTLKRTSAQSQSPTPLILRVAEVQIVR